MGLVLLGRKVSKGFHAISSRYYLQFVSEVLILCWTFKILFLYKCWESITQGSAAFTLFIPTWRISDSSTVSGT